MTILVLPLARILDRQHGVISRAQLAAVGLFDAAVSRRTRRGEWQRLLPGVYATTHQPPSPQQLRVATCLYAGPDAQLTGVAALLWYGFRRLPPSDRVHALVPHATRRRTFGFAVMLRTHAMDGAPRDAGPYRVASPARAAVDACRSVTDPAFVRAIMTEAASRGDVGLDALVEEVRRAGRSRTALAHHALAELAAPGRTAPGAALRDLVEASTVISGVRWSPTLVGPDGRPLPTPDGYLADAGIAIEADDSERPGGDPDLARTVDRHTALSRAGILVLRFSTAEIQRDPSRVRQVIEEAYRERLTGPAAAPALASAGTTWVAPPRSQLRAVLTPRWHAGSTWPTSITRPASSSRPAGARVAAHLRPATAIGQQPGRRSER